ncbi:MAG TPA: peptidoglycan-binding protein [Stellaceae bacterium]|nr:peptidoglycan-binding protein [Stellaceae bacterium]
MNRTLTAAAALAVAFGMAGLAQAQTATPSSPMTTSPSASQPGMSGAGAPSGTQNPATMSAPGATSTYGTSPQANTSQMNMGPQGQSTSSQGGAMQASQPASQSQILQAQEQLKTAGLYRGAVDGVMGPETQTALMKFQREQGLPETAQLDQQTLSRLSGGGTAGTANSTTQRSGATQGMTPSTTTGGSDNGTTGTAPSGSYNR